MTGDRTVVNLTRLATLENIAYMSARYMLSVDEYINLAILVGNYVTTNSLDALQELTDGLNNCHANIEQFKYEHATLISLLRENGNLGVSSNENKDAISTSSGLERPDSSNVIPLNSTIQIDTT